MRKFLGFVIFLFMAANVMGASNSLEFYLTSGNAEQSVKAGEYIEPILFTVRNGDDVYTDGILNDLDIECGQPETFSVPTTCKVSGRVHPDVPAGAYGMNIIAHGVYDNATITQKIKIIVKPTGPALELLSGTLDQTLIAGDSIEPIVFRYQAFLHYSIESIPKGVHGVIDETEKTFTIIGKTNNYPLDKEYEYTVTFVSVEGDTTYLKGKFTVSHTPGKTVVGVIENETQTVNPGDSIKPIVLKYQNVLEVETNILPEGFELAGDTANKTITVTGKVPEDTQEGSYRIDVYVKGPDNKDTAYAFVNVTGKAKVEIVENETQTVNPGDSIKPIVFKYKCSTELYLLGNKEGLVFEKRSNDSAAIVGVIPKDFARDIASLKVVAKGPAGSDTAYATINVMLEPFVELLSGKELQEVYLGDSIEPLVFKFTNVQKISVKGYVPKGVEMVQDKEAHTLTFIGKVNEDNVVTDYEFTVIGKRNDLTGTEIYDFYDAMITVKRRSGSSSSAVVSSSSVVVSSSSETKSSSSIAAASSSSVVVSSSSETKSSSSIAVVSSSSVVVSSSSETKSSSSIAAASSSSVVVSSSSETKSSSSKELASSSSISSEEKSSSSVAPKSSSGSAKSSSSTKAESSSSKKSDALVVTVAPRFSVQVLGRSLQISAARVGTAYALFDMQGKVLLRGHVQTASFNVVIPRSGNYLLRIGNRTQRVTVE